MLATASAPEGRGSKGGSTKASRTTQPRTDARAPCCAYPRTRTTPRSSRRPTRPACVLLRGTPPTCRACCRGRPWQRIRDRVDGSPTPQRRRRVPEPHPTYDPTPTRGTRGAWPRVLIEILFAPHWDILETLIPAAVHHVGGTRGRSLVAIDEQTVLVGDGVQWSARRWRCVRPSGRAVGSTAPATAGSWRAARRSHACRRVASAVCPTRRPRPYARRPDGRRAPEATRILGETYLTPRSRCTSRTRSSSSSRFYPVGAALAKVNEVTETAREVPSAEDYPAAGGRAFTDTADRVFNQNSAGDPRGVPAIAEVTTGRARHDGGAARARGVARKTANIVVRTRTASWSAYRSTRTSNGSNRSGSGSTTRYKIEQT